MITFGCTCGCVAARVLGLHTAITQPRHVHVLVLLDIHPHMPTLPVAAVAT
jgi:hypothetical protein